MILGAMRRRPFSVRTALRAPPPFFAFHNFLEYRISTLELNGFHIFRRRLKFPSILLRLVIPILTMVGPMFTVAILLVLAVSTIISTVVSTVVFLSTIDLHQVGTKVVWWSLAVVRISHRRPSDISFRGHACAEIFR